MSLLQEERFLMGVISALLSFCEIMKGNDNKTVVGSNIMWVCLCTINANTETYQMTTGTNLVWYFLTINGSLVPCYVQWNLNLFHAWFFFFFFACMIRFEYLIFVFLCILFRYVFGQYSRFLNGNWEYLIVVVKKLFDFMHATHPGVKVILPFFKLDHLEFLWKYSFLDESFIMK